MPFYRACGYCGEEGHNRRTCSSLTDYYKLYGKSTLLNGASAAARFARMYTKRTGLDLDGNFVGKPKQRRRASTKRCSWCRSYEHNKRTCPERTEWLEGKNRDNEVYRSTIQERAKALAIGVGSLLSESRHYYTVDEDGKQHYGKHQILGLIEKIDWDEVNCDNREANVITVNWVNCPTDDVYPQNGIGRREKKGLLASLVRPDHQWNAWDVDVVGYSDNPTAGMPDNWVSKKGSKFEEPDMSTHWY